MAKVNLSTKDVSLMSDLLGYEQWAAKKCQLYAQTIDDPEIKVYAKRCSKHTQ